MDYSELKVPNHVGIIVDGNGRWAQERGLSRSQGHDVGFKNLKEVSNYILEKGVKYLSVFAFSTENFKRSKEEVDHLMNLFVKGFKKEKNFFLEKNIKVIFSGKEDNLRSDVIKVMRETEEMTKDCTKGVFNVCLNYGGQSEIVDAINKIIKDGKESVTVEEFSQYLYQDLPAIDFMIRTSGEVRISNFMLWQLAYAELYFPKTYFPDFNSDEFDKAVLEYNNRDRRYGGINYKK